MASRYDQLIEKIFFAHYKGEGTAKFEFDRSEVEVWATDLGIQLPKNIGDVIYSFRYRKALPEDVVKTAPEGMHWIIEGAGSGRYRFSLRPWANIEPRPHLCVVKIPDATPQIISAYALSDEQALLAKLRYNRLLDVFLGITAYSLQNHLRTTVRGIGQIEIDEIYVGINKHGSQFIVPVQAKGANDKIGFVQTSQDIAFCAEKYPNLICRAVAAQFFSDGKIALFEIDIADSSMTIIEEKHYELAPEEGISKEDLRAYRKKTEANSR